MFLKNYKNYNKRLITIAFIFGFSERLDHDILQRVAGSLSQREDPVEKIDKKVDESTEKIQDKVDESTEKIQDDIHKSTEKIQDDIHKSTEDI